MGLNIGRGDAIEWLLYRSNTSPLPFHHSIDVNLFQDKRIGKCREVYSTCREGTGEDRERQSREGRWYICIHFCPTSSYLRVRHRSENVATTDTAHPTGGLQSYRKQKSSSIRSMSDAPPSLMASDSPPRRELRSTDRTSRETLIH